MCIVKPLHFATFGGRYSSHCLNPLVWSCSIDFFVVVGKRGSFGTTPESERRFDLNRRSYFIFDRTSVSVIYLFITNDYSVICWTGYWASYQVPWSYPSIWYTQDWCDLCWAWTTWQRGCNLEKCLRVNPLHVISCGTRNSCSASGLPASGDLYRWAG